MDERLQQYDSKMQKAYDFLATDFAAIRAGRANPHEIGRAHV